MYYCPKCAAQNVEAAHFCRSCGADIRLVPQAMTGRLPAASSPQLEAVNSIVPSNRKSRRRAKDQEPVRIEKVVESIFLGAAFLLIFLGGLIFFTRRFETWVWFIIPAFALLGDGVGKYLRYKQEQRQVGDSLATLPPPVYTAPAARAVLPPRDTSEMATNLFDSTSHSVTEGTTRHLEHKAAID